MRRRCFSVQPRNTKLQGWSSPKSQAKQELSTSGESLFKYGHCIEMGVVHWYLYHVAKTILAFPRVDLYLCSASCYYDISAKCCTPLLREPQISIGNRSLIGIIPRSLLGLLLYPSKLYHGELMLCSLCWRKTSRLEISTNSQLCALWRFSPHNFYTIKKCWCHKLIK